MRLCCHNNAQGHILKAPEPLQKYSQEDRTAAAAAGAPLFTSPASDTPSSPSDDLPLSLKRQSWNVGHIIECSPFSNEGTEVQTQEVIYPRLQILFMAKLKWEPKYRDSCFF